MHRISTAPHAILAAATRANLQPADLLRITAAALAEKHCNCRSLPNGTCVACREADYLHSIADMVSDLSTAVVHVLDACLSTDTDLPSMLPGIVEGMLDLNPATCSCTDDATCPICTAARYLDETARFLQAA